MVPMRKATAQPQPTTPQPPITATDYVKWIEGAGARTVPLHYDAPESEIDAVLQQVNGVIFPGGNDIIEPGSPYYTAARFVFDRILAMNDG
jgi:gamma-glutamyl-gamma-aminobutyrate hydrolase PuuD